MLLNTPLVHLKKVTLSLKDVKAPIQEDLRIFEQKFAKAMRGKVPLLNTIMKYVLRRKGKQMRPLFVLLMAKLCGGITEKTYRGATLVELLHTATLVHDDVVDDAYERRGFFSINALWKNKIAVLIGDYLLSRGLLLSVDNEDFDLLKIVSRAVKEMSEGELLQMEKSRTLNLDEAIYFDIIRQKTATLIASACMVGCASTQDDTDWQQKAWELGETIGLAFQIKDDLFDFGSDNIGKPKGIDIKEKKLTLPIIYALNKSKPSTKRQIIYTIKKHHKNKQKVAEVIDFVWKSGGIAYATQVMYEYRQKSLDLLAHFPKNEARDSLEKLIWFVTERRK